MKVARTWPPSSGVHGYDLLTTLAAKLDATVPTGANPFPECLNVLALQVEGLSNLGRIAALAWAMFDTTGKVVVNTSWGFGDQCDDPATAASEDVCTPETLHAPSAVDRAIAGAWQRSVLSSDADSARSSTAGNDAARPLRRPIREPA